PVEPSAVVEASAGPAPAELPPIAHTPGVVALPVTVDVEPFVAHQDLAVDLAWDFVPGRGAVVVRSALGLPLEIDAERNLITDGYFGVERCGLIHGEAECLVADAPMVERRLARVIGPEAVRADLEPGRGGEWHLEVGHGDDRPRWTDHER